MQPDVMAFVNNASNIPDFTGNNPFGAPGPHPGASIASHLVDTLLNALLPQPLEPANGPIFLTTCCSTIFPSTTGTLSGPTITLGNGMVSTVKSRIEALIRGIIQSPEYQLS
ncbi:MAG: hypothetical protein R3B47_21130 [Bacteroidia bacterium]